MLGGASSIGEGQEAQSLCFLPAVARAYWYDSCVDEGRNGLRG